MSNAELMIAAVKRDPDDTAAQVAAVDALIEERDITSVGARRVMRRARETGRAAQILARAVDLLRGQGAAGRRAREQVRRACPVPVSRQAPIDILDGDVAPWVVGSPPHYTFTNGGLCYYPRSARAKGHKTVYHRATQRITVGARWVAEHCS